MWSTHLKNRENYNKEIPFPGSVILHYFICRCEYMSSAIKYACSWFLIQNGKKYLLFKQYLNGDFPKVVDNNECHENAGYSPNTFCLTCVLHSTDHTIYVSVIKNGGMGFAHAEMEVCGYSCGDTVSISKLQC